MSKATRVVVDGVNYPLDDTTAVDFSEAQSLSTAEKQQARTNIGAADAADVTTIQALIGNTALPTTAQTITEAIAEHETDISDIKSTIGTVPSGSNLQGEVDDLKSAFVNVTGYEQIEQVTWTNGESVNDENGDIEPTTGYKCTGYVEIPVFPRKIKITSSNAGTYGTKYNAWYDSSKNFISNFNYVKNDSVVLVPPENAKYFVLSCHAYVTLSYELEYDSIIESVNKIASAEYKTTNKRDNELSVYGTNGYLNATTGAFVSNENYTCYYFTVSVDGYLWFSDIGDNWIQVAVYDGTIFTTADMISIGSTSRSTLPTESAKMSVSEGNKVVVAIYNTDEFKLHYPVFSLSDSLKDSTECAYLLQKNSSDSFSVICIQKKGSDVRYDFTKYQKTWDSLTYTDGNGVEQTATNVKSTDYWNNLYVYNNDTNDYIAQGNTNFITQVGDENYHTGDGHGNEVIATFSIIADGNEIDISAMGNGERVKCDSLRILEKSFIYELGGGTSDTYSATYPKLDTSGNPIVRFLHTMEIIFKGTGHKVLNRLKVMQNNVTFFQCLGAMLECYYTDFDILSCNNAENSENSIASDGTATALTGSTVNIKTNPAVVCDRVEMYGKKFFASQKMNQDNPANASKSNVRFVFYDNRVKAYFQPVFAEFGLPSGETADTFNSGDVISVTNEREINA